ncbi:MAG: XdhC family protein, partial [Anaerolineae bacterium]
VIVSDARRAFLKEERFPDVEIRFGWPQDVFKSKDFGVGHAVVVLFHDSKFDVPALKLSLRSDAFYIGFLGSRKTQADRRESLMEIGFTEQDWARVHGPVGLDIGGKEPPMIALSILAEIVAVRNRREGGMMGKR